MDYIQAIELRHAVRTYNKNIALTDEQITQVKQDIKDAESPFGGEIQVKLHKFNLEGSIKPTTYGAIDGASWYILIGIADNQESYLTAGFKMGKVALQLIGMGLGTNFLTDTFKGSTFAKIADFGPETPLHVIMPVGVPAEKMRLTEKLTHFALGSSNRKAFDDLFSEDDFGKPVSVENPFHKPLEYMRTAPSAYNKQPWRALVKGNTVYFYETDAADATFGVGIALSIFYYSLLQLGLKGSFAQPDGAPDHDGYKPLAKFTLD